MKLLFVCRANIGRSQAAMAFYNLKHPGLASSAVTVVDVSGEQLQCRIGAANIVTVMKEYGVDMSEYQRQQINIQILNDYDKIVLMAEPETIPDWLRNCDKVITWNVPDPKGQTLERTRAITADIKQKVDNLNSN